MVYSRRKRPRSRIKQRHLSSWLSVVVGIFLFGIVLVVLNVASSDSDDGAKNPTAKPTQSASPSAVAGPDAELREQFEQFIVLYKSPATPERTVKLRQLCLDDQVFRTLAVDGDAAANANGGKGVAKTKVLIDASAPNKFKILARENGFAIIESSTFVQTLRPGQVPLTRRFDAQTIWKERDLDGWKFVEMIALR